MRRLIFILFLILLAGCNSKDQDVPTIHSSNGSIRIKDGQKLLKDEFKFVPGNDTYNFYTSSKEVTFYTDLDSITFNIDPKKEKIDFLIIINGTDTAFTKITYRISNLEKLKEGYIYDNNDNKFFPEFEYQSQNDSSLVRLRNYYNLDSVAGDGNEIVKIINLMYWVHNSVRHDNVSNPYSKNAIDLINICKAEDRGVNCRGLAIILNECYLALGIKSRYITCLPRDKEDKECHVINTVYSAELEKWIWIDPTFAAYVMDENGQLLGINEVRERLINDKPLVLNPDANWNKKSTQKEFYLEDYMAKNLYRLNSPINSRFNYETQGVYEKKEFVELLPFIGTGKTPRKAESGSVKHSTKIITYITNNSELFWKKPN